MQLMIGVFDFPAKAEDDADVPVPELVVSHVSRPSSTSESRHRQQSASGAGS